MSRIPLVLLLLLALTALSPAGASATQEHAAATTQEAQQDHGQQEEHAAAEEHAEGGEHEGATWAEYAMKWVNTVLLAALLYWVLVVPPAFVRDNFEFDGLRPLLARRTQAIRDGRQLAAEQRADAVRRVEASAARLARIQEEATALTQAAGKDAEREQARQSAEAVAEAERIRQLARRDMQGEVVRAGRELRAHTADSTVAMATEILRRTLSPDDQQRLIREYLERLGTSLA